MSESVSGGNVVGVMDARSSRSDTHAETPFLAFDVSVLTLTVALGLPGNLWVCWLVIRTRSLQTCNNALLVSLAASDLLRCSVDAPLLLRARLRSGDASLPLCAAQQFAHALASCAQLLTLVAISVERFHAIAFPFRTERRRARVQVWLWSVWAGGLALAAVSVSLPGETRWFLLCRPRGGGGEAPRRSDPFGPFLLVPLWTLSVTVILIYYGRIFRVVRQHRKRVFTRGVQLRPTVSEKVWEWTSVSASAPPPPPPSSRGTLVLVAAAGEPEPGGAAGAAGGPRGKPLEIVGAVCLLSPMDRERGKKRMEGRLAQRFGYIIIAFTLFWLPMVVLLLLNGTGRRDPGWPSTELETSAVVLTSVQAAVDPLIYTLVTRQFRSELGKILPSLGGCRPKARG